MESIRSNEVQIVGQQLLTELQEEDERNLLQQLNDARKCEILAPPTLHAHEPLPAVAVNTPAPEILPYRFNMPFNATVTDAPFCIETFLTEPVLLNTGMCGAVAGMITSVTEVGIVPHQLAALFQSVF